MKIICLVEKYLNDKDLSEGFFVHNRNLYNKKNGIDVEVVSFSAETTYYFDNIKVYSLNEYLQECIVDKNTLLICHAANLKHHYIFLKQNGKKYSKIIFYFHGHEVLKINEAYSKPFDYMQQSNMIFNLQNIYDNIKIKIWKNYIIKNQNSVFLFFVSDWMKDMFLKYTKLDESIIKEIHSITYNAVGAAFEEEVYHKNETKEYDFITIRGNLDNSKYGIDIVNNLAFLNPTKRFFLVGKGEYFQHFTKAPNLEWHADILKHDEIIKCLKRAKIALMPTRTDAQGVMACEIATIGMPLITSDIPVCHEIFNEFNNVKYINNDNLKTFDEDYLIFDKNEKNRKYIAANTNKKEFDIIKKLIQY